MVKSSQQRQIRAKILEQYPDVEPYMELLLPKKAPMVVAKCLDHVQIVLHEGEPLFFCQRDGPFMPTLRVLHKVPHIMKWVRADKGAIPFVLSGANVMCPGLTSKGGEIPEDLPAGTPVAIMAEGKQARHGNRRADHVHGRHQEDEQGHRHRAHALPGRRPVDVPQDRVNVMQRSAVSRRRRTRQSQRRWRWR
ncbi:hypothetical protein PINS_up016969 [Pythium insidiosum]|nr:hypothetical protein PINS_up016969 [Pythium insidiosum]